MQKKKHITFNNSVYVLVEATSPQSAWDQLQQALMAAEQTKNPSNMMKVKKGFLALQDAIGKVAINPKKPRAKEVKKFLDAFIVKTFPVEGADTNRSISELRRQAFKAYRYFEGISIMDPSGDELGALMPPQIQTAKVCHLKLADNIKGKNDTLVKNADVLLRSLTEMWHELAGIGGDDRNNPSIMATKLLIMIDHKTIKILEHQTYTLTRLRDFLKNTVDETKKQNSLLSREATYSKKTVYPTILKTMFGAGATIPAKRLLFKGARYQYVGKVGLVDLSALKKAESLSKELQHRVFNYNRNQLKLIGGLQARLRDAWEELKNKWTGTLSKEDVPTDRYISLFDTADVQLFSDLLQSFQTSLQTARSWQPKVDSLQNQLHTETQK